MTDTYNTHNFNSKHTAADKASTRISEMPCDGHEDSPIEDAIHESMQQNISSLESLSAALTAETGQWPIHLGGRLMQLIRAPPAEKSPFSDNKFDSRLFQAFGNRYKMMMQDKVAATCTDKDASCKEPGIPSRSTPVYRSGEDTKRASQHQDACQNIAITISEAKIDQLDLSFLQRRIDVEGGAQTICALCGQEIEEWELTAVCWQFVTY